MPDFFGHKARASVQDYDPWHDDEDQPQVTSGWDPVGSGFDVLGGLRGDLGGFREGLGWLKGILFKGSGCDLEGLG